LMEDLAQHVAVVAVGYERKGDGNEFGQGVLGHTEITGRADVIIEIKRKQDGRRLEIIGRTDAPDEIDFAMGEGGVLDVADLDAQLREKVYEAIVSFSLNPTVGPPSKNDIHEMIGGNRGKVLAAVDVLQAEGRIRRMGAGNRSGWGPVA
ncbi:MAG TPA: hypothetical protein VMK12_07095, partial [Anaeromyxobacteraceae bacterium]|nr:hypothetical protein [Anaeromyxobacteraceae bacterium]